MEKSVFHGCAVEGGKFLLDVNKVSFVPRDRDGKAGVLG